MKKLNLENATASALLVIDVQQGLFQKSTPVYKAGEVLQNIHQLIERARAAGVPVIFIQHHDRLGLLEGSPQWQLHESLQPATGEVIVHKEHPNAFEDTHLQQVLKEKNAGRLVVCGLVTHGCVRASCMGALELGYQVTLASDAHSSYSGQAEELIEKWHARLGSLGAALMPVAEITFSR